MREILFRGKRTTKNEFVYGSLYVCGRKDGKCEIANYNRSVNIERFAYEVIPETVGQYTGLTDKNGNKIFEGDIVEFYINDSIVIGKVFYTKESTAFEVWYELPEQKFFFLSKTLCDCENVKVIGNIHDNPELLKEANANE